MSPASHDPAPATTAAGPSPFQSECEAAPDLVKRLAERLAAGPPSVKDVLTRIAAGETCRAFNAIETEFVLIEVEKLLSALEIVHGSFRDRNDLDGVRRVCEALDPIVEMTVAQTAKLRTSLFGEGG